MSPRTESLPSRRLAGLGAALGVLLLSAGGNDAPSSRVRAEAAPFWQVGIPLPIGVHDGRATFRLPLSGPHAQTVVIVSALSRGGGPFPILLAARRAEASAIPDLADDGPRRPTRVDATSQRTRVRPTAPEAPPGRIPPPDRTFHMMAGDGDPGRVANYVTVRGILKGVGRRVQVYVESGDVGRVSRATIEDIILTFDEQVYPMAVERYSAARDVDGDGRLTVLLSGRLEHLGGGRQAVDGFVKVADLDLNVPAPFGNRCDMIYLSAAMCAGPYLRTVLAHEYMHAVVYTCKSLDHDEGGGPGLEEEGWLDEAIAHLAEDQHAFSPSNIDYRVSAYLSCPERYGLVVDDYFASNLFRSHGNRGSTYLFLRWCVDRYGPGLIARLVDSPRRGIANLEAATGSTFADLFRRWSVAMFLSGLDPSGLGSDGPADGFRSTNLRSPWADGELAGPRCHPVIPGGPPDRWNAAATSCHFALIEGGAGKAVEVDIAGPPGAELQVTAIPLGDDRASMSAKVHVCRGPDGRVEVVARVTEQGGVPVRLSGISWEPLVPAPRSHADGPRPGRLDMLGIAAAFGTSALPAHGELVSRPIPMPGISASTGPIMVKVLGTDPRGRRAAAWAELDPGGDD